MTGITKDVEITNLVFRAYYEATSGILAEGYELADAAVAIQGAQKLMEEILNRLSGLKD